jgi:predicted nucleic acid-binding protein
MILVDTSVWIEHLRSGISDLSAALEGGLVLTHPFVVGELACGNMVNRLEVIRLLQNLAPARVATDAEALVFIEARSLAGKGIGYIDVHLLASTQLSGGTSLWTRDRRLHGVAEELRLAHR